MRLLFIFKHKDGYYSMLPRLSWYQVNYQPTMNKNGIRKYLAFTVNLQDEESQKNATGGSRKRRDTEIQNTDTSIQFEIGMQTECVEPRNRNIPCNGPVRDGQKFRY